LDKIPYYRNRNNYIFYRLKDICYFDIMYYENINQEIINFALIKNPYLIFYFENPSVEMFNISINEYNKLNIVDDFGKALFKWYPQYFKKNKCLIC